MENLNIFLLENEMRKLISNSSCRISEIILLLRVLTLEMDKLLEDYCNISSEKEEKNVDSKIEEGGKTNE